MIAAELELEFYGERHATRLLCVRQDPPWKVVRGFPMPDGGSLVHLNNVSGGIFGGDRLKLVVTLAPRSEAQLTTTGATRVYRPKADSSDAYLSSHFHLGEGAVLDYLPDALIPFKQARVYQQTCFSLSEGATLFCWDTLAPGRAASGEIFAYERLKMVSEVTVMGVPCLIDRILLEPARWPMGTAARFGSATYLVTFLAVHAGLSILRAKELEANLLAALPDPVQPDSDYWGVTTLPAHGVMVRGALHHAADIPAMLFFLWSVARQYLLGRTAVMPRKTY